MEENNQQNNRPWGFFSVLSISSTFQVKKITVYPGKRLSHQRHLRRSEHWHIVEGNALVTLNQEELQLHPGESVDIAKEALHRVQNVGTQDLVFVEVQRGDYFGEDDIERIEDDFGRK